MIIQFQYIDNYFIKVHVIKMLNKLFLITPDVLWLRGIQLVLSDFHSHFDLVSFINPFD
jgi:hypothetical protein